MERASLAFLVKADADESRAHQLPARHVNSCPRPFHFNPEESRAHFRPNMELDYLPFDFARSRDDFFRILVMDESGQRLYFAL